MAIVMYVVLTVLLLTGAYLHLKYQEDKVRKDINEKLKELRGENEPID